MTNIYYFRNIHEALDFARRNIGINFYVDPQCQKDLQVVPFTQYSTQPSTSYSHAVEKDNTNRLDFCRHCDSLIKNFRILNNKCSQLEKERENIFSTCRVHSEEIRSQQERILSLSQQLNEANFLMLSQQKEFENSRIGRNAQLVEQFEEDLIYEFRIRQ